MALKLNYFVNSKLHTKYCKITNINWNTLTNVIALELSMFKDLEERSTNSLAGVQTVKIILQPDQHNLPIDYNQNTKDMNLFNYLYQLIKTNGVLDKTNETIIDFYRSEDI